MRIFYIIILTVLYVGAVSCFPEGRVVNGTDSEITKYPFIVSLRSSTGSHSCGASIIAPKWILTAAHCVVGKNVADISIQYATTEISAGGPNIAYVQKIIVHESYNPSDVYVNDIALLKLLGEFIFNGKSIAPVNLPEAFFEIPQTQEGVPGTLVGWGRNATEGGTIQKTLQEVALKIYSDEECHARHGVTKTSQICGGVDEGGKGQCNGDSGGPLFLEGHIQLGIVSWSIKPCTVYPYPGVFTKVSHYIGWIKMNMV